MIHIGVNGGLKSVADLIREIPQKQLPFVTSLAINRTAQKVKTALVDEMDKAFDRPTPYTKRSLYIKASSKKNLSARVWLKDDTFKGTPADKYLGPEIFAGARRHKKFERALIQAGLMRADRFAVPGAACPLDAFGNVSAGFITRLLAYLKAFGEVGYKSNMDDKGRARIARKDGVVYFVARPKSHLPEGVWARYQFASGSAVKPVLLFVKAPTYTKRYKFFEVSQKTVDAIFIKEFEAAFAYAMATAK